MTFSAELPTPASGTGPEAVGARLGAMYEKHGRMVLGLCRVLLKDPHEAEDAAQQTFLSAHRSMLAGHEPDNPPAWLATIARNECRSRIRDRMRTPLPITEESADTAADPSQVLAEKEDLEEALTALAGLPERQREAVVLRSLYGLSYREVAAALGTSVAVVETLLFRGRRKLNSIAGPRAAAHAALIVPIALRDDLARLIPGFEAGATAAAGAAAAGGAAIGAAALGGGAGAGAAGAAGAGAASVGAAGMAAGAGGALTVKVVAAATAMTLGVGAVAANHDRREAVRSAEATPAAGLVAPPSASTPARAPGGATLPASRPSGGDDRGAGAAGPGSPGDAIAAGIEDESGHGGLTVPEDRGSPDPGDDVASSDRGAGDAGSGVAEDGGSDEPSGRASGRRPADEGAGESRGGTSGSSRGSRVTTRRAERHVAPHTETAPAAEAPEHTATTPDATVDDGSHKGGATGGSGVDDPPDAPEPTVTN